jgi:cytochrome c oxidase assembly protein subunit 15
VPDAIDGTKFAGYERPLESIKGWKEMVHRYAASLLGFAIFALFFLVIRDKTKRPQTLALPAFTALFVMLQGAFGMWTVTLLVHPGIVTTHLVGGFVTTALLTWLLLHLLHLAQLDAHNKWANRDTLIQHHQGVYKHLG